VCAVAAFAVAFFAAGGGGNVTKRPIPHSKPVAFADSAASAVSFAGIPAALKLPPPPKHVKHHKPAKVTAAPAATPPTTTPTVTPPVAPVYTPPKHKSSGGTGGTGTGTTVVGP